MPDHEELKRLLLENQKLLTDNNRLLRKMRRDAIVGVVFKLIWLALMIGLPFYLYFYFIEPTLGPLQEQMSLFKQLTGSDLDSGTWSSFFNRGEWCIWQCLSDVT